ncbi:MAG: stage II sporulation protein R, partial [Oscillospiraceae bacterium]|nr:stage II sporulation protein R [Oscillospiraceae bacterium]
MSHGKLHLWEAALLLACALTLTTGVWAAQSQSALAGSVLRLHVLAHSDSPRDQALKLQVRDAVLERAGQYLTGIGDRAEAEALLASHLDELADAGAAVVADAGYSYPVWVTLADSWFPTRRYEDFSLPAGVYRALRVTIGEGAGQNWWCVVFPPLCLASVTEEAVSAAAAVGLSEGQVALITGQDGGYVLKFKLVEWWSSIFAP